MGGIVIYLEKGMGAVRREAVGADAKATVQAKDVLLVLLVILMDPTTTKECLSHKPLKPCSRFHTHVSS